MKRYKDCKIISNENLQCTQILDVIGKKAQELHLMTSRVSSNRLDDTLWVHFQKQGYPNSRIVMTGKETESSVSVVNIIPNPESGVSHIDMETYNRILDVFVSDVLKPLFTGDKFKIEVTTEDYSIADVIPKSFPLLKRWLEAFPLSGHSHDLHRWYDFVISLHCNKEHLSLDTFSKYLKEAHNWDDETINELELKLESHFDLLEYYDEHR